MQVIGEVPAFGDPVVAPEPCLWTCPGPRRARIATIMDDIWTLRPIGVAMTGEKERDPDRG